MQPADPLPNTLESTWQWTVNTGKVDDDPAMKEAYFYGAGQAIRLILEQGDNPLLVMNMLADIDAVLVDEEAIDHDR